MANLINSAPAAGLLRFENFELDLRAGELRKRGVKLRLQGQPLQVLATLLQRRGELVTHEELRTQIWPADTFVDFDHSLHNAIARIREVLGDSAGTPRYIETLPRRGYRFIAQVEEVGVAPAETRPTASPGSPAPPAPAPRTPIGHPGVVLALTALLILSAAAWLLRRSSQHSNPIPPLRSIAVLPLDNLSGDPSQDFFVDGMTEQLITDLAKISALRVTSRTSVMRYKGARKPLPEIARELKVDGIIEGSVMRSGNRVRITAQLLNGPTDQHLWAETYERDLGDVLRLQSEVAQAIAHQVRAQLTPQQQRQLNAARPVNPDAYDAYLRGRFYLTTQFTEAQGLRTAQRYFQDSIQKDPGFALAYAGLADTYAFLGFFHLLSPEAAYRPAKEASSKALELDDSIGEAHDTNALLKWRYEWDWNSAEQELRRAIALSPSYPCSHEDLAILLAMMGRRSEALEEIAKSAELDPGPSFSIAETAAYYQMRDYPGLVVASHRGILSDPSEWTMYDALATGDQGTGKLADAIPQYQKAVQLSDGDQDALASLANAYALAGRRADARKILQDLERRAHTGYVSPYSFAVIYAGLGDKDRAFTALEKAYLDRAVDISWSLKSDPHIDSLRSDPRFESLLRRVAFPH